MLYICVLYIPINMLLLFSEEAETHINCPNKRREDAVYLKIF